MLIFRIGAEPKPLVAITPTAITADVAVGVDVALAEPVVIGPPECSTSVNDQSLLSVPKVSVALARKLNQQDVEVVKFMWISTEP